MISESDFQKRSSAAVEALEERLSPVSEEHDFEVELAEGILSIYFEDPSGRFIVSPNSPARQIWVSALSTSYKFDWDDAAGMFVLDKTREPFVTVMGNLISRQLSQDIRL